MRQVIDSSGNIVEKQDEEDELGSSTKIMAKKGESSLNNDI